MTIIAPAPQDSPPVEGHRSERRWRRPAVVKILPRELLLLRDAYRDHLIKDRVQVPMVSRRLFYVEEFLSFLVGKDLSISANENIHLTHQYKRHLQTLSYLTPTRRGYRFYESTNFIHFVIAQRAGQTVTSAFPLALAAGKTPVFKMSLRSPRDASLLRKILGYEQFLCPSPQAQASFDLLYNRVVEHLVSYRSRATSWKGYRAAEEDMKKLLRFMAECNLWMPAHAITKQTVEQYVQWCENRGHRPSSTNRYLTSLRRFLKDVPGASPSVFHKIGPSVKATVARPMDFEDAQHLRKSIDPYQSYTNLRDRIIIDLLLGCGLRIGEVLAITPDDVFKDRARGRKKVIIPETKTHNEHVVELPPSTQHLLDELERVNLGADISDRYFVLSRTNPKPYGYDVFLRSFKRRLAAAGLETKIRIHSLRATFATYLLSKGVARDKVSAALNHRNPNSIRPYDAFSGTDTQLVLEKHHPLFSEEFDASTFPSQKKPQLHPRADRPSDLEQSAEDQ